MRLSHGFGSGRTRPISLSAEILRGSAEIICHRAWHTSNRIPIRTSLYPQQRRRACLLLFYVRKSATLATDKTSFMRRRTAIVHKSATLATDKTSLMRAADCRRSQKPTFATDKTSLCGRRTAVVHKSKHLRRIKRRLSRRADCYRSQKPDTRRNSRRFWRQGAVI